MSIVKDVSKLGFVWNIRKIFIGKIHTHKKVETYKTNSISVANQGIKKSIIQADGELIGEGDFEAKIISKALRFVVP